MNHAKKSTWHQSENFSISTYYTIALLTRWPGEIPGIKKKNTSLIKIKFKSGHGALGTYNLKGSMSGFFFAVLFFSTFFVAIFGDKILF